MTKNVKQHVPVFLSSTYTDLAAYRSAVLSSLEKLKVAVTGMEVFGARSKEPLKTCLEEVSKCQVFVGLLGMRYGSLDEETGKSFVHLEYEKAAELREEILIYLIDEEKALLPPKAVDVENARKLIDFKALLKKKHTIGNFSTPEDLAAKVEQDLVSVLLDKGFEIEKGRLVPTSDPGNTLNLLNRFNLMPERFSGSEMELIIKLTGKPGGVSKDTCKAIGLAYGSSLKRDINIVDPPGCSHEFATHIYAQYEGCDFIYDASEEESHRVLAKLAFGQQKTLHFDPETFMMPRGSASLILTPLREPTAIRDLETGEIFHNYISYSPVKAIVFVKSIGAS